MIVENYKMDNLREIEEKQRMLLITKGALELTFLQRAAPITYFRRSSSCNTLHTCTMVWLILSPCRNEFKTWIFAQSQLCLHIRSCICTNTYDGSKLSRLVTARFLGFPYAHVFLCQFVTLNSA